MTLAELEALRDALVKARLAGTRAVEYGDHRVEYKSDGEMRAALADAERRIAALSAATPVSVVRFSTAKGV